MSDRDLKPLNDPELADMERWADGDLGVDAGDGYADRLRSMVFEIRMHRDAMAPSMLRATRLYTDEIGALRKRVAELEEIDCQAPGAQPCECCIARAERRT